MLIGDLRCLRLANGGTVVESASDGPDTRLAGKTTLRELLTRYCAEVTPGKRGAVTAPTPGFIRLKPIERPS